MAENIKNFNRDKMDDTAITEKLPPQNIEAEECLLGCLMIDKNAIIKVVDFLGPEDFYKGIHQKIYETMQELFEKREPIDILSLSARLQEKSTLEQIGGRAFLTELINSVPNALHVSNYAKIIQRKRILRDMIQASYDIGVIGHNETEDIDVLLDQAEKKIFKISQTNSVQNFVLVKNQLEEAFERIDVLHKRKDQPRGVPTGFVDLDKKLAGLQKSDLVILASRPSMGKSSLALDIAKNCRAPVGIFSLEMSKDQIIDRLIAAEAGVDLWKLRTGQLSSQGENNDFFRIQKTFDALSQAPIYINDNGSINILQMRAMARRLQAEHNLGLIIVDYLQLMDPRNTNISIVQQMTEISKSLKGLAKELNVPVLALSQLSRAVEQRIPQIPRLSDLRETGAIEQDADVVLFIYREDKYRQDSPKKNIAKIIIAKHRNGPTGEIELYFDERRASFKSLESNIQHNNNDFA